MGQYCVYLTHEVYGYFMSDEQEMSKEERILKMMKRVLTDIAKETFTKPGYSHPLSDNTIQNMRECLTLITSREHELMQMDNREPTMRPRFIDEPRKTVVVPIDSLKGRKDNGDGE